MAEQGAQLARALLASRATGSLRVLHIDKRVSPAAAQALLQGLAALLDASLSVVISAACMSQQQGSSMLLAQMTAAALPSSPKPSSPPADRQTCRWGPSADLSKLQALTLRCNGSVQLDMACLASAARLARLIIWDCPKLHSWQSVSTANPAA
jgi:hypothetical protein